MLNSLDIIIVYKKIIFEIQIKNLVIIDFLIGIIYLKMNGELKLEDAALLSKYTKTPWECNFRRNPFDGRYNDGKTIGYQLVDACSRGTRFSHCTAKAGKYHNDDIMRLLHLMPYVVKNNHMFSFTPNGITPFYLACANNNVDMHVIREFVKLGGDINRGFWKDGQFYPIIQHILDNKPFPAHIPRLLKIQEYFDTLSITQHKAIKKEKSHTYCNNLLEFNPEQVSTRLTSYLAVRGANYHKAKKVVDDIILQLNETVRLGIE
jgi:hypothetical protein